jgi:N-acetylglucosaminyldiphosphoundecaprenol N-acetyl-beta-D-mannosaminyltransferase
MLVDCNLLSSLNYINSNTKSLIVTLNAHSYRLMQLDSKFQQAILNSTHILPDGIAIVHFLKTLGIYLSKISGSQLFFFEMERINKTGGKIFFLGSTKSVLLRIQNFARLEYPNVEVHTYSPPFKQHFSNQDNTDMINAINAVRPDVLFVGMTAPKQEKWAYEHFDALNATHVCCIGAVFDFYAGTVKRPPKWMIAIGLEWLGRLIKEPKRMWHRYLISSPVIYLDLFKLYVKSLFIAK